MYRSVIHHLNSVLCVGLDPVVEQLPQHVRNGPSALFGFNRWVIDQTHPYAAAYKLNTAFYEAHGADGWAQMASTVAYLRERCPQHLLIADAKRADIGHTNAGYVRALFDVLGFDAVTLHPYLGGEALAPFLERADKLCFVLCRTSNPGAGDLQGLDVGGVPLWVTVARKVRDVWNAHGNCGLVVGATAPDDLARARAEAPELPLLVPGVGAQGGDMAEAVRRGADVTGGGVFVSVSRAVALADDPAAAARALHAAAQAARGIDRT